MRHYFGNAGYVRLMIWGIFELPATKIHDEFKALAPLDVAREWGEAFWTARELWHP